MRKSLFIGMMVAGIMMLGSCGGGSKPQQSMVYEEDSTDIEDVVPRDKTIYGLCGPATSMNTLEVLTDSGDTLHLSITRAQEENQVFGGLQSGDRLAIMANLDKTVATKVINLNALLGDWVMPDPLDGSDEIGIRIKEGGVAESIEMTNITYRTWRIFNGKLEITSIRESGGEGEETNYYDILKLSQDTLVYKTIGKPQDEEETLEYSRWREKPAPDLHGLKLEEHQDEFMKM